MRGELNSNNKTSEGVMPERTNLTSQRMHDSLGLLNRGAVRGKKREGKTHMGSVNTKGKQMAF